MNRYLMTTYRDPIHKDKISVCISVGSGYGIYYRTLHCNGNKQLETRSNELDRATINHCHSVVHFANDKLARQYARDTQAYLNS